MKKNRSTIILILIFLVGLSVMLYPTVSDYVNQRHQSRALASYDETVNEMSDADYTAYFEAADAYNQRLAATPNSFFTPEQVSGYDETLDVSGTGIMGYITIPRIGVELPVYHGTSDGVLQVVAGHLRAAASPWAGRAPMRSSRPTAACPAPSCSPIWTSWKRATRSPSRCWTGC